MSEEKSSNASDISLIISDALMRANKIKTCLIIYVNDEDEVCVNYKCTRVERLGMLTHVLFHEMARSVKEVDDYDSDEEKSD